MYDDLLSQPEQKSGWRKATASNEGAGCVELVDLGIAMRDSTDPHGHRLYFTRLEFAAFRKGVLSGEFDYLLDSVNI